MYWRYKDLFGIFLEQAKGNRSINEYGRQCQVSGAHISRLMRGLLDTPPTPQVIKLFASHAYNGVSYKILMMAAQYLEADSQDISYYTRTVPKLVDLLSTDFFNYGLEMISEKARQDKNEVLSYDRWKEIIVQRLLTFSTLTTSVQTETILYVEALRLLSGNPQVFDDDSEEINPSNITGALAVTKSNYPVHSKSKEKIPILGRIAAGNPITAIQENDDWIHLDSTIHLIYGYPIDEYFCLHVAGVSMEPTIHDGEIVLVHWQDYLNPGEIGAFLCIEDNESTIKRYQIDAGKIILVPDNKQFPIQIYSPDNCRILGRVLQSIRRVIR